MMKTLATAIAISLSLFLVLSCASKEKDSERFIFLTNNTWESDSLLVNGFDAGGPGGILEMFNGEARFYEDGSGYFGEYEGMWYFTVDETYITISSDDLALPLTCKIIELTNSSFKITTVFTDQQNTQLNIRITFTSK